MDILYRAKTYVHIMTPYLILDNELETDFQNTFSKCRKVDAESIKHEKLFYKLLGSIIKVIAPLM